MQQTSGLLKTRSRPFSECSFLRAGSLSVGALLLFLVLCPPLHAQSPPSPTTAAEWIARARAVSDIRAPGSPPFHLHATFHSGGDVEVTGDGAYDLLWLAPDKWREEITLGTFHRVATRSGDLAYEDPQSVYIPVRAVEVAGNIFAVPADPNYPGSSQGNWTFVKAGTPAGEVGIRWEVPRSKFFKALHKDELQPESRATVIIDTATGHVLKIAAWSYSDFFDFHGKAVARHGSMQEIGREVANFRITALEDAAARPESDFALPNHSGHVVQIPHVIKQPKTLKTSPAKYPRDASERRISGTCVVALVVDPQGRPHDVRILRSLDPSLDRAAVESVRQYLFEPGTSDGQPANLQISFEITFQIE